MDGFNFRRIARHLEVNPQTVINWVNAAATKLPAQIFGRANFDLLRTLVLPA